MKDFSKLQIMAIIQKFSDEKPPTKTCQNIMLSMIKNALNSDGRVLTNISNIDHKNQYDAQRMKKKLEEF